MAQRSLIAALRLYLAATEGVRVRVGGEGDVAFVRAVAFEQWRPGFAGLADAVVAPLLDQQFRAQQHGYATMFPGAETGVIEREGVPVGSLTIARNAADCLHLVDIALLASACGKGIGTHVLTALIAVAREEGCRHLTLSVALTNHAAERLYTRLGFRFRDDPTLVLMSRDMVLDL